MSINIVDKRVVNRDRTTENRQRFLKRIKATIKEQLPKIIGDRSLRDIDKAGGKIRVNRKTITEPFIRHGEGGNIDRVLPGNEEYVDGDEISKPKGGGQGRGRGDDTEDDFIVELSREEFLREFFEGLELPDLAKTDLSKIKEYKRENAGFQPNGSPNRLSVERSYRGSLARRITLRSSLDRKINDLRYAKLDQIANYSEEELLAIDVEIDRLLKKRDNLPLFEEMDLRYHLTSIREIPVTHATMVMIMDNSGSMGKKEKTIARKFFWLLYKFLDSQYEHVDMIFISHTETAIEMDEDEFFNTRISGGTVVSSALDLCADIIETRLVGKTNIYIAQVSDGDNEETDNGTCAEILEDDILPFARYYAYMQVDNYHNHNPTLSSLMHDRGLWKSYKSVADKNARLQVKRVFEEKDIYPVFRELLSKKKETK